MTTWGTTLALGWVWAVFTTTPRATMATTLFTEAWRAHGGTVQG